jgi:ABC-type transport system substrate-binding protein
MSRVALIFQDQKNCQWVNPGIEVYNPKTRPIDVAGDIASHYMIYNDPSMMDYYNQFRHSINPEQQKRLQQQYEFYQQNYGEDRPYEKWYEMTGLPGYFRGYPFQQWEPEFVEQGVHTSTTSFVRSNDELFKRYRMSTKPGLYANIHAKRERIKAGSGEQMRKVGSKGAPTAKAFKQSLRTAKRKS